MDDACKYELIMRELLGVERFGGAGNVVDADFYKCSDIGRIREALIYGVAYYCGRREIACETLVKEVMEITAKTNVRKVLTTITERLGEAKKQELV